MAVHKKKVSAFFNWRWTQRPRQSRSLLRRLRLQQRFSEEMLVLLRAVTRRPARIPPVPILMGAAAALVLPPTWTSSSSTLRRRASGSAGRRGRASRRSFRTRRSRQGEQKKRIRGGEKGEKKRESIENEASFFLSRPRLPFLSHLLYPRTKPNPRSQSVALDGRRPRVHAPVLRPVALDPDVQDEAVLAEPGELDFCFFLSSGFFLSRGKSFSCLSRFFSHI